MGRVKWAVCFDVVPVGNKYVVRADKKLKPSDPLVYYKDGDWTRFRTTARGYTRPQANEVCNWLRTQPGFWPR